MSRRRAVVLAFIAILLLGRGLPGFGQTLYWENPKILVPPGISASSSAAGGSIIAVAWQEIRPRSQADRTTGDIFLSLSVSRDGRTWTPHARFFGPIPYTGVTEGNEPRVYSMAVDARDRIVVAVTPSDRETVILQSLDEGATFTQVGRIRSRSATGAPSLFFSSGGGFLMLVSQGTTGADVASGNGSVSLAFSHSPDGKSWPEFSPLITQSDGVSSPQLQPTHATFQGKEYVIFQSLKVRSELTRSWQLYAKTSADGGATWDKATEITSVKPLFGDDPLGFDNERPRIAVLGTQLGLVWERSSFGTNTPRIWAAHLDEKAAVIGAPEILASDSPARFARAVFLKGLEYALYADGSSGAFRIVLAQKRRTWETQPLLNTDHLLNALFPHVVVFKDALFIFWENQQAAGGSDSLVQLEPLSSVGAPIVRPVDFVPGELTNRDAVTVSWSEPLPQDPAGIKEYQYTWTYDNGTAPVEMEKQTVSALGAGAKLFATRKLDKDGTWKFSIVAVDLAGNITAVPGTVSLLRDATPPKAVSFEVVDKDGNLVLSVPPALPDNRDANSFAVDTNTFTLRWQAAGDKDIVGYTFNTQPGWTSLDEYRRSQVPLLPPPERVVTTAVTRPFINADDGVYAVTVRAIDRAGNYSPPSTIALALSNYEKVTYVARVDARRDPELGTVKLTILGRGFTQNGTLAKIYLDRRGGKNPPWDMEFDPAGSITVTDRTISGITLDDNRASGSYKVGLLQDRADGPVLYFTPDAKLQFESPGTVKIGNFQILLPRWIGGKTPLYAVSFNSLMVALVVALLGSLSYLAIRKIGSLAAEGAVLRTEVIALIEGRPNIGWEERKKRMQTLKRRGVGLRLKFTLLMVVLVTMIVLIVSIPLGFQMVSRQTLALASGLQNQANILMDALAASAETQFRLKETGFEGSPGMPKLRRAMTEATYTTITGPDPVASPDLKPTDQKDFVWASDQQRFVDELGKGFQIAKETVDDDLARNVVGKLQKQMDGDAVRNLSSLIDQYRALRSQYETLSKKKDATLKSQLADITARLADVSTDLDTQAKEAFAKGASLPLFDPSKALAPTYLFYRPVIFYNYSALEADDTFYQGLIRLEVRTAAITRQIDESIWAIIQRAGLIALIAIGLGVLGAIIMANITVTPIRKLAEGVKVIRDTADKEKFKGHPPIQVRTRDEIGDLAENVNEMSERLADAAIANKELMLGKDVQKMFLPLEKDRAGRKGSTAEGDPKDKDVEIYGYYEGAAEVSGDYFDFRKLDETHYALIKCDVSGHGVSAGLIMVEVATLFISHFSEWESLAQTKDPGERQRLSRDLEHLDRLVYKINDMLEKRGFKGLFAAFTICVFNSATGAITVCPAGDNEVNIYDVSEKRMVHRELTPKEKGSPAAGVFPSMLVEMKSGFPQFKEKLDHGDVLFLPTDGIDEAKRYLRNTSFEVITCQEPGLKEGEYHLDTHKFGTDNEDFGKDRMDEFITGVFNKGRVNLVRHHNPIPNEELGFDFSTCDGTVKEAVLAVVSAEKVFRMVLDPTAGDGNKVEVDAKIDAFLKKHFIQYQRYFAHRLEGQPDDAYVQFSHLVEDEQRDDLTILVVRRK
jgi:HAMP domain-containing protein